MDPAGEVVRAARARATALARADAPALTALLHPDFRWTTHLGDVYDRQEYVARNTDGRTVWRSQELGDLDVAVVGDTAVLLTEVTDIVMSADDEPATFRMPVTQVWVRVAGAWQCLAGHAGPRRA